MATVSFIGSLVVGNIFFEHLSENNDEAVYVLQAQTYRSGSLTLSDSAHGDAFRPWMSGRTGEDRLVLVQQPTLPTLMAISDLLFGTMRVALAAVAAGAVVAVFAVTRELARDDRAALLAAGCFVLSPLVVVQSAMFVSYVLAMALAASALTFILRAVDRRRAGEPSTTMTVTGGLFLGLLLATRPLEGMVFCVLVPVAVWLRGDRSGEGRVGDLVRTTAIVGLAATPVLSLVLVYNTLTNGDPFTFALWTIGGDDSFGFGYRSIAENAQWVYVGPSESWLALRTNLRAFPHWIIGGLASLPLGAWGAWVLYRRAPRMVVLLGVMLVLYPFAYFFYYGNYLIIAGRNLYGPHYYLPLLIPSMVLLGIGLRDVLTRRWPWIALAATVIVAGTAIEVGDKVRANLRVRDDITEEVVAVEEAVTGPAIVIVPAGNDGPYILHPRGAFSNPPGLDAEVLYAADLGTRNLELLDRFPDRRIYRFLTVDHGDGPMSVVEPLQVVRGERLRFQVSTSDGGGAVGSVVIDERTVMCASGVAAVTVEVRAGAAEVTGCDTPGTVVPLDGAPSHSLGFTASRPADSGSRRDTVVAVFTVGTAASGQVVTLAPPKLAIPVGDGFRPMDGAGVPWLRTSVVTTPGD